MTHGLTWPCQVTLWSFALSMRFRQGSVPSALCYNESPYSPRGFMGSLRDRESRDVESVESVESECDMWPRGLECCGILWESASRFMDLRLHFCSYDKSEVPMRCDPSRCAIVLGFGKVTLSHDVP